MKRTPENLICEICGLPAIVEMQSNSTGAKHIYCGDHRPAIKPGQSGDLQLLRYRSESDGPISRLLAMPEDSTEHAAFRDEMCKTKLMGEEGAVRYYLSKLTASDQYTLWDDEFFENVSEFVSAETGGAAAIIPIDMYTTSLILPLFRQAFERSRSSIEPKLTAMERAIVLLLHHPSWSNQQIADEVPTTTKQLGRNGVYNALRIVIARASIA